MSIKTISISIILSLTIFIASGQTNSPSPYTSFGVGRIENMSSVITKGMGGSGIALPSTSSINLLNAASLTSLKAQQMKIDIGLRSNYTYFNNPNGDNREALSGGLNNISLAFPINKFLFTGISLDQYSSRGYNINTKGYIKDNEGTPIKDKLITKNFKGEGGLNRVSLSEAIKINKNISIGLRGSFIFGQLIKTESFTYKETGVLSIKYTDFLYKFTGGAGFQYNFNYDENNNFRIGGIYSFGQKFNTDREVHASSSTGAGLTDDNLDTHHYEIPNSMGAGISWIKKNKFKISLDYNTSEWSKIDYSNSFAEYKDSYKISGGIEFRKAKIKRATPFLFRAGVYYEDSYIKVKGNSLLDKGVTAGIGIPMRNNRSYLNVSIQYGLRGEQKSNTLQEHFLGLNISLSIIETWFYKHKFE